MPEYAGGGAAFDHAASVHHHHACHVLRDHAQVVRDQQQRHGSFRDQVVDQVEDLPLDRDVQRGGGLIGNQQIGFAGQGHGNRDALALAAGELVWIGIHAPRGIGYADAFQQRDGVGTCCIARHAPVQAQWLRHLVADRMHRVQRRHGFLEDHADAVAAQLPHHGVRLTHQFPPVEADAAGHHGAFRQQSHQRHRGDGLAAARLSDQTQGLTTLQGKADAANRIRRTTLGLQAHAQVVDFQHAVVTACVPAADPSGRAGRRPAG